MLSNSALLIITALMLLIAQFSPFTALVLSILLCTSEVVYLYINQEDIANV